MPLVWVDGFEDALALTAYGTGQSIGPARTGNGMVLTSGSGGYDLPLLSADIFTIGFAMKTTAFATANSQYFLQFVDTATATRFAISAVAGQLLAVRGSVTVLTSSTCLLVNTWHYVEMQVRIHDTLGSVTFRCDGVSVGTVSGVDTNQQASGTTVNALRFSSQATGTTLYDDFVLQTGSLSDPFYGDVAVETLVPTGNGDSSQFVGSDGNSTDNYALVDEVPSSMSDYVASATVGQRDLYQMSNMTLTTGTVVAVVPTIYALKDEVGPRTLKPIVKRSAVNAGSALALDFAAAVRQGYFLVDPETGAAWTQANVNALQAGVEVA